tara:strand:+ start:427 stop:705 length:279 start_codon:yes stop_codon:yes gene_type:complete
MAYVIITIPFGFLAYWLCLLRWFMKTWKERKSAYIHTLIIVGITFIFGVAFLIDFSNGVIVSGDPKILRTLGFFIGSMLGFLSHIPFTRKLI